MATTELELGKRIETLLDRELTDEMYESVVGLSNRLTHAVTLQHREPADAEPSHRFFDEENREGYILNRLGHISANPSNAEKRDVLSKVYAYAVSPLLRDKTLETKFPNYNKHSTHPLLVELLKASRKEHKYYLQNRPPLGRSVFMLVGERGVGKTFLLNHFFTIYHKDLDDKNIVWVRINVSQDFGVEKPDVRHWLLSQTTYVVLKYYMNHPKFSGFIQSIKQHFGDTYPEKERERYISNFRVVTDMYCQGKAPKKVTADTIENLVAVQILDEAIRRGMSFIFVVDGFDKIDVMPKYRQRLAAIKESANSLTAPDTRLGGCYLFVFRTETLRRFVDLGFNYASENQHINIESREVQNVSFLRIVVRRLNYLRKNIPGLAKTRNWNIDDWPQHIDEFKVHLSTISESTSFQDFVSLLEEFYGPNHRAKVELIQLAYHSFLQFKKDPKQYKLIEAMCKGGFKYPPNIYRYDSHIGALMPTMSVKLFDNVLMPTITNFPYHEEFPYNPMPQARSYVLASFRILQFMTAYQNHYDNRPQTIPARKMINTLRTLFKYQENVIVRLIEEYSEYNFLLLSGGAVAFPTDWDQVQIEPTPKLRFVLGDNYRLNVLSDIAYLNMCAMRTLANAISLSGVVPFFKAMCLEEANVGLSEWIIWKILNTVSVYRVIRKAALLEDRLVENAKSELTEPFLRELKWNAFLPELRTQIGKQISGVLKTVSDMRGNVRIKLDIVLGEYENAWGGNPSEIRVPL
ncbi:MAG: hypothetical protein CVU57_25155 [Deltaproteobacteria bacterium HGW-Deltaproteobacteria-15]|jgi:hypothetical protein|nr:MAG: hypothetical protein CVU57_25155 [Deltaproteobacteria bacterium HGW-Deltaproteobacteria-15]